MLITGRIDINTNKINKLIRRFGKTNLYIITHRKRTKAEKKLTRTIFLGPDRYISSINFSIKYNVF